jgi:hypothetical protein
MARTVVLREYGHQEHYDLSEDFDLWARIAAKNRLANLPEVLVRRRMHRGRITLEKAHRIKDTLLAIYASQLSALGVAFTDTDLERHFLLRSMRKLKFTPDLVYVEWAEAWLLRLQAANQRALYYPEPSFSEALGRLWLKVCWHALAGLKWTAWRRFWRSPLRKSAWPGLRKFFSQYSTKSLPRGIEL